MERWLWLHEYQKAYKGTLSVAVPVSAIKRFGTNEDGTTWIATPEEMHIVTESFGEIYEAVTAEDWESPALSRPPEQGGEQ